MKAPVELMHEDFESKAAANIPAAGQAVGLDEYVSAVLDTAGSPMRYTASGVAQAVDTTNTSGVVSSYVPFWLNKNLCNGMLVNNSVAKPTGALPNPPYDPAANPSTTEATFGYCATQAKLTSAWPALQTLSKALGQLNGKGDSNTAVAAYTVTTNNRTDAVARNLTELQMRSAIPVPQGAGGRYVTFSVAMAASACKSTAADPHNMLDPNVDFYFMLDAAGNTAPGAGNSNLIQLNSTPANPCSAPNAQQFGSAVTNKMAEMYGDKAFQLPANQAGISMMFVNRSANTAGNDAAFDDIKVTDVTPQAYKSFGAASMPNHGTTPLTFYFVNTTALSAIANMTLTDVLPTGMTPVGAPSQAICETATGYQPGASALTASITGSTINLTGSLAAGTSSCRITIDVKVDLPSPAAGPQTLVNGVVGAPAGTPGSVTTTGINAPGPVDVLITPAVDMAVMPDVPKSTLVGTPVTVSTSCTNLGPDVALGATCAVSNNAGGASTCTWQGNPVTGPVDLPVGGSLLCTTSITPTSTTPITVHTVASTTSSDTNSANNQADSDVTAVTPIADMEAIVPTGPIQGTDGRPRER